MDGSTSTSKTTVSELKDQLFATARPSTDKRPTTIGKPTGKPTTNEIHTPKSTWNSECVLIVGFFLLTITLGVSIVLAHKFDPTLKPRSICRVEDSQGRCTAWAITRVETVNIEDQASEAKHMRHVVACYENGGRPHLINGGVDTNLVFECREMRDRVDRSRLAFLL